MHLNNKFGRLPEKESPPGPYQASTSMPPFGEVFLGTEASKALGNVGVACNGNSQNTAEQIQVQLPPQVGNLANIIYYVMF